MIIGIDPGLNGAIAFYSKGDLTVHDMPTLELERGGKKKREIDIHFLVDLLEDFGGDTAFIEQVWSHPKQGVSSVFSFGQSYGIILGVLAACHINIDKISPQKWKADLRVPKGKDAARARASELMPRYSKLWPLKKHDGRAEAALLAYYGWEYL